MNHTYANRKRTESAAPQINAAAPQPSMDALRSGAAQPTAEQMGHRVDLPDAMRSKMEDAFGADLSAVKLYESQSVADAGATAMTQGANIAFAPGMLDFTSFGGQSLLGHEISHVVSQARGEVTGGGFLNDHALEARADREGAMAAAGQTVAVPTAAMSTVSAANAAGPMQAKDKKGPKVPLAKENPMKFVNRTRRTQSDNWMADANYGYYQKVSSALDSYDLSALKDKTLQAQAAGALNARMNKKREGRIFTASEEKAETMRDNPSESTTYYQMLAGLTAPLMGDVEKAALAEYKGDDAEKQRYEAMFSAATQMVNGSEDLQNMIGMQHGGFAGSQLSDDDKGETIMTNFFLRAISPYFTTKGVALGNTGKKKDAEMQRRYYDIGGQLQALANANTTGGAVDQGRTKTNDGKRDIWRSEALRGFLGMGKGLLARGAAQSPAAAAPAPVSPPQQLPPEALGMPAPSASASVPLPVRAGNRVVPNPLLLARHNAFRAQASQQDGQEFMTPEDLKREFGR